MQPRPIPSLPDYVAFEDGSVMRLPYEAAMPHGGRRAYGGRKWKGVLQNGRPTIMYKKKNYRVSRLVCEAFHGPAPFPRAVVMHLNDDPTDNRPENLRWGTQKENLNTPKFIAFCKSRTGDRHPRFRRNAPA
jgi:hypothetical protein